MTEILLIVIAILTLAIVILAIGNAKIKRSSESSTRGSESSMTKGDVDRYDALVEKKKRNVRYARETRVRIGSQLRKNFHRRPSTRKKLFQKISSEVERLENRFLELDRQLIDLEFQREDKDGAIQARKNELNLIVSTIQKLIDEQKRKAMEDDFYKLGMPQKSISRIRDIESFLEKFPEIKSAISAAIYSHFYAAEVSSLCNRVLGEGRRPTGIYKITNTTNGFVYVGQSVDIRNRWTQHIRRAVGVEKETQNLLYPAMREFGVWNFSFEVLEECEKDILNKREILSRSI